MNKATLLACSLLLAALPAFAAKIPALIIDGQNNHDWKATTPVLKQLLEQTGLFTVDVATTPPAKDPAISTFKPDFARYGVIVMNYNGDDWSEATRKALEDYMRGGGGMVVFHAADNAFPKWKAYNEMIAVGGWFGRNEQSGVYLRWRDGKPVLDAKSGPSGHHGPQHEFVVETRAPEHPIMQGLPVKWLHPKDELYDFMRGPATNATILATAFADPALKGSGEQEPQLLTIRFGEGRVFHTMLGHGPEQMKCVGFIVTLQRGTEWAATGKVTQKVPVDFPGDTKVSLREQAGTNP
jgi:type 1 glutamine amidotransferase